MIILLHSDMQYTVTHIGLKERQQIVVGFDFHALRFLTSDLDIESASSFDGFESRHFFLLGLASTRSSNAAHLATRKEHEQSQNKNCFFQGSHPPVVSSLYFCCRAAP